MIKLLSARVHWQSSLLARQPQMTPLSYQAKELWITTITHDHTSPQHSACEMPHMHSFLPKTDCFIHHYNYCLTSSWLKSYFFTIRNYINVSNNCQVFTKVNLKKLNKSTNIYINLWKSQYSQTCIRQPLLGPLKSDGLGQVVVL